MKDILNGNLMEAKNKIFASLFKKIAEKIEKKKAELANEFFGSSKKKAGRKIVGLKHENEVINKDRGAAFDKLNYEV